MQNMQIVYFLGRECLFDISCVLPKHFQRNNSRKYDLYVQISKLKIAVSTLGEPTLTLSPDSPFAKALKVATGK